MPKTWYCLISAKNVYERRSESILTPESMVHYLSWKGFFKGAKVWTGFETFELYSVAVHWNDCKPVRFPHLLHPEMDSKWVRGADRLQWQYLPRQEIYLGSWKRNSLFNLVQYWVAKPKKRRSSRGKVRRQRRKEEKEE